jgi:hypothetical protein
MTMARLADETEANSRALLAVAKTISAHLELADVL